MEARRDPVSEADPGHGRGVERARVEDGEVGRVAGGVDDEPDEPALVLAGPGPRRDEDELPRDVIGAEVVHVAFARLEVVLVELRRTGELRVAVGRDADRVDVAVALPEAPLIDAGEFLRRGVGHAPLDPTRRRIDDPAFEPARCVEPAPGRGEHCPVGDDVEDHPPVGVVVGVGGVEHEAGLDGAPEDVGALALSGEEAHAGPVVGVPAEREAVPGEQGPERERDGQVQHDHEARGDRAIVDAGAVRDRDRHVAHDLPARCEDDVAHAVPDAAVIRDGVSLGGQRVAVRVPGEGAGQRPVERVVALLLQGARELDGEAAGLHHREDPAADLDDVGVDGVVAAPPRPGRRWPLERRGGRARVDPAVAIPQRPAALERETVHHAVAEEPVVTPRRRADGVGPHLEVEAVEAGRDRAGDGQVLQRQLRAHRFVDADDEGVGRSGQAQPVARRQQADADLGDRAEGRLDSVRHRRRFQDRAAGTNDIGAKPHGPLPPKGAARAPRRTIPESGEAAPPDSAAAGEGERLSRAVWRRSASGTQTGRSGHAETGVGEARLVASRHRRTVRLPRQSSPRR